MPSSKPISRGICRAVAQSISPNHRSGGSGGGGGDFACGARMDFDGSNGFVTLPISISNFPGTGYRIKFKMFMRSTTHQGFAFGADGTPVRLYNRASNQTWVMNNQTGVASVAGYHEIEVVNTGFVETLFVDGVQVYSNANAFGWAGIDSISIGANNDSGSTKWNGTICDILINSDDSTEAWNHAYAGRGNTNTDWEDLIGSANGTVNGSPGIVYVSEEADTLTPTDPGCVSEPPFEVPGGGDTLADAALFWLRGNDIGLLMSDSTPNARHFLAVNEGGIVNVDGLDGRELERTTPKWYGLPFNKPDLNSTWHFAAMLRLTDSLGWYHFFAQTEYIGTETGVYLQLHKTSDQLQLYVSADGNSTTLAQHPDVQTFPEWVFVEIYHDADLEQIGIATNGGAFVNVSHTGGIHIPQSGDTSIMIGKNNQRSTVEYANGAIGYAGLFNRRLTEDERITLYGSGTPAVYPFT